MLRKERVLEALRSLCAQRPAHGGVLRRYASFSAEEVAEQANVDRTNASRDLNLLVQEGLIERIAGRPVLFVIKTPSVGTRPLVESRSGENGKWGDLQPVLPTPLTTQEPGKPPAVAASVRVGAVVTSFETLIGGGEGLKVAIQQAKAAMLYPPRGLHTLLYGPSGVGKTTLLLLAATSEDPNAALLPTFRRRIPMTISLPGLSERTMMERYELLRAFFTTECSSIGAHIHVAPQVLRALLLYECPGNIGQLRTDVQLACARAYLEYRTNNLPELVVHPGILPDHVRRGLLRTAELQRSLEPVLSRLEATHIFTPTGLSLDSLPESAQGLYDAISSDLNKLRRSGLPENEINRLLHLDIQHYFQRFANKVSQGRQDTVSHLVDERILSVSEYIVQYTEPFFHIFAHLGGSGATWPLVVFMLRSRSAQLQTVGKVALGPAIFNINEPVTFGIPMALNPLMMIPFVLVPVTIVTINYFVFYVGLVHVPVRLTTVYSPARSQWFRCNWRGLSRKSSPVLRPRCLCSFILSLFQSLGARSRSA